MVVLMARRDRIPLTTPITRTTLKGWRPDPIITIDSEHGTMSGSISYYDTAGKWVRSERFEDVPGVNGDLNLSAAKIDTIIDTICTKLINKNPALAGTRIVDTVVDSYDTVVNP
jgi:hypothetical protein